MKICILQTESMKIHIILAEPMKIFIILVGSMKIYTTLIEPTGIYIILTEPIKINILGGLVKIPQNTCLITGILLYHKVKIMGVYYAMYRIIFKKSHFLYLIEKFTIEITINIDLKTFSTVLLTLYLMHVKRCLSSHNFDTVKFGNK